MQQNYYSNFYNPQYWDPGLQHDQTWTQTNNYQSGKWSRTDYEHGMGPKLYRGSVRALDEKYYNKIRKVIKTTVQSINLKYVQPTRAGIIIYTVYNNAVYFGLGLDSKTHDLTDFGGTVKYKMDGDVVKGALREFTEETLDIFEPITPNELKHCPVLYDNDNCIIFMHVGVTPDIVSKAYNNKFRTVKDTTEPEICGITWLTWEDFSNSIKSKGVLYERVRLFLVAAEDFAYLL